MPTPNDEALLRMDGWPGGVNNRVRETEQAILRDGETLPSSQFLRQALNVDLTAEGHPIRRKGYTLHTSGYSHSAWGCDKLRIFCVVMDGQLMVGRSPSTLTAVADVNRYNRMSYCFLNDTIYYSNGQQLGEIYYDLTQRSWGIPVAPTPAITGPSSENPGGWTDTRQVSVTYVDYYGREGGASEAVLVGATGQFDVTLPIPLPEDVAEARIYVSQLNSEILYHAATVLASPTTTIYDTDIGKGKELDTQNLKPPQAGQLVAEMNGRIYIARNSKVIFTEPLRYELTRPSQGIFMFSDFITLLEPVQDGLYVGTNKGIVFIDGADPYSVKQVHVSPYAPVEQATARVPGEKFGVSLETVPVWWGTDGVMMLGLPKGELRQLTRDRLAVPEFQRGAVSVREYEGMSHVVSSLYSGDGENAMGATDTVVAEVRQNNIVLNS